MRNLKLAFRTLFKTPFVTVVAILSLALGIGANAAIFSLFNEMLLSPLPVPHPERLVNFGGNTVSPGSHSCGQAGNCDRVFSYKMFRDLESNPGPFTSVAAHVIIRANVAFRGQTLNTTGELVSGSYFPTLAVGPSIGRLLNLEDDKVIGGHPVVVLSHDYWQTRLGADPGVIGQQILVNGQSLTIVGVTQVGFEGTTLGNVPAFFVPLTMRKAIDDGWNRFDERRTYWAYVFARLKPGVSIAQASAQENVVYHRIINEVEVPLQQGISPKTLERFKAKTLLIDDGRQGLSTLHEQTRMPLILLFSITGIVLAIACANIANLLLARGAGRSMEIVVRLSLGATRKQLLAQLLTESVLLAVLGGVAGLIVAYATLKGIASILPMNMATNLALGLSGQAIAFAALLSTGTGFVFGLFPALHSTRPNLATALRDNSSKTSSTRSATRFRSGLVTGQIALSMALLVSAGLFIKSLANVSRVNLGIRTDDIVTFHISPELNGYTSARSAQFFDELRDRLAAIPGVHAVSTARVPVLGNSNWDNSVSVQGFAKGPDVDDDAYFNAIGPGFFALLEQPLVAGREFTMSDVVGAPKVAIVNEAFVKKFGIGREPVGKLMGEGDSLNVQIVGVVKDARYSGVKQTFRPVYYLPSRQDSTVGALFFYVKSSLPSSALAPQVRSIVASLDRNLPVEAFKTLPQQIKDNVYLDRMISMLSAAFAALATLLAAIGLYGVLAYSVTQRTREIGVRMALGASSRDVLAMVLRQVAVMTVIGSAVGAAAADAIGRGAASLLFEMQGHDAAVMGGSALLLAAVAIAAGYAPALRASRVDPMQSLRYE